MLQTLQLSLVSVSDGSISVCVIVRIVQIQNKGQALNSLFKEHAKDFGFGNIPHSPGFSLL